VFSALLHHDRGSEASKGKNRIHQEMMQVNDGPIRTVGTDLILDGGIAAFSGSSTNKHAVFCLP
jgi:hypothetical protein